MTFKLIETLEESVGTQDCQKKEYGLNTSLKSKEMYFGALQYELTWSFLALPALLE